MKVLVLGASGLVGWNLFQSARSLGHATVGTYHTHVMEEMVPVHLDEGISILHLLDKIQPHAIFHCAGWSWVDGCEQDSVRAFRENAEIPARIARYAAERHCQFTYFSTSYVFDGILGPYDENAPVCPLSVYGRSKRAGEEAVIEATAGRALIVRTMGVYGPEPQKKSFVHQVRRALAGGKPLRVPHDQYGNVSYAPDLARMVLELAQQKQSGIWNLAGPDARVRRNDFACQIARSYGLQVDLIQPVDTAQLRQAAVRPREGGLLIEKAVQATSIVPRGWVMIP